MIGFDTSNSGLPFLGFLAGGDWELPLFFIVYYDGKSLRGYIPEDGNTYNHKTNTAYGSEMEYIIEKEESNFDFTEVWDFEEAKIKYPKLKIKYEDNKNLKFDWKAIERDVSNRIILVTYEK